MAKLTLQQTLDRSLRTAKSYIDTQLANKANSNHNHTSLTDVTSIAFATEGSDSASISTTVEGTNTYFDFNLSDDHGQPDMWRWRFNPSGGTLFSAMELDLVTLTEAKLTVTGNVTATSFTEDGVALSSKYAAYSHGHSYIPLSGNSDAYSITGSLTFADSGTTGGAFRGIQGINGTSDYWRFGGSQTGSNEGYTEIASADDGNEPIYVRQYTGAFSTLIRTATLLDAEGNTFFPGLVNAPGFKGRLTGDRNDLPDTWVAAAHCCSLCNSTVGHGEYSPMMTGKTRSGRTILAFYNDALQIAYMTEGDVMGNVNQLTSSARLFNEAGDGWWSGKVTASALNVNDKVQMQYNSNNESLDFIFI